MKILLIRNDNIGDLACTTPLVEVLHQSFPQASIDFLGNSYNIELVRHDPRLSQLWSYGKAKHVQGLWKKIKAWIHKVILLLYLRQQRYDIVIIAISVFNKRTTRLARWIRPHTIYGPSSKCHRLPKNYCSVFISQKDPHVLQVLTYAKCLGVTLPAPKSMSLFLSPEEKKILAAEQALVPGKVSLPIIGLQISARRPKQRWNFDQWKQLIDALLPHARLRLLWSPGSAKTLQHPGDDALAQELATAFPTVLAKPTTNLRELMVAFSTCNLIVGSDGGAMHIAAALNVATVTFFGDIDPTIWQPYSEKGTVITSPSDTLEDLNPIVVSKKVIEIIENIFKL